ncbi:DUF1549 domain-containing protein, partial [bacterium]|nr:DUF1549 domain-containing protein [bacterium]
MVRTTYFILLALTWPAQAEDLHWAFLPLSQSDVSEVHGDATNPIDHFVEAKLHANRLTPGPQATKRILIRRLYFDLVGLPPPPDEVSAFLDNA